MDEAPEVLIINQFHKECGVLILLVMDEAPEGMNQMHR
ncbi:hypothetical protein SAMN05444359_101229 [Neolewinella agarilytica]|uniref:Uncharacterized protein n=1 Tax=Neolewinella agarilytica TaxID=478744 RepID=A0A1H8Z9A2_9BACT|nr:hypothetical protein SAMN05444359_101229 [Neolewinella agarilytica]